MGRGSNVSAEGALEVERASASREVPRHPAGRPGARASVLHAAVVAGLACGALFGTIDAVVAARIGTADLTALAFLGCAAGAVFQYTLLWTAGLVVAALVLHPLLARKAPAQRALALMRIGLVLGLFLELYWWSRPFVFYGQDALGAPRLAATAGIALVAAALAYVLARPFLRLVLAKPAAFLCAILAVAVSGMAYVYLQGGKLGDRGVIAERNEEVPNVLLVVVDALRQDTLGCYGSETVRSPRIDELAREGVLFENAFVQAPFTWTSFGSLLTGKYPRRHGLLAMAPGLRFPPNITLPFHLEQACFEEGDARTGTCLQQDDFLGATFHTGTLSTGSGLLRGFDVYYEQMAGHGVVLAGSAWSVFRSDLLVHVIAAKTGTKLGSDTAVTAKRWLDDHGDRRFVAMVHLYSTHTPYDPPQEFRGPYCDPAYDGPVKAFYAQHREAIERGEATPTAADVAQIKALYYAGVTEADHKIGMLCDALRERGVLDDTIVIVTSDHGESLGEPGLWEESLWEHDHMVQTNLRIPLVMRWPKGLPAGVRVDALVDEIDVVPTVCDLMGIKIPHEEGEYGRVDGTSLMPLVRGEADSVREFSFAENGLLASIQDRRWKLVVPAELLDADTSREDGVLPAWLVDLESDPGETRNAAAAHPDEVRRLMDALLSWSASMPIRKADEVISPRERERQQRQMEALGYGGGRGAGGVHWPGQPAPK